MSQHEIPKKLTDVIMRFDRMRRVEHPLDYARASGSVIVGVQYVEDIGYLLRELGVEVPEQ